MKCRNVIVNSRLSADTALGYVIVSLSNYVIVNEWSACLSSDRKQSIDQKKDRFVPLRLRSVTARDDTNNKNTIK